MGQVLDGLAALGVTDYTLVRNVAGQGQRGMRWDDELTDVFTNAYVIVACEDSRLSEVVNAVRPALARFGGMCLVSDAMWVVH